MVPQTARMPVSPTKVSVTNAWLLAWLEVYSTSCLTSRALPMDTMKSKKASSPALWPGEFSCTWNSTMHQHKVYWIRHCNCTRSPIVLGHCNHTGSNTAIVLGHCNHRPTGSDTATVQGHCKHTGHDTATIQGHCDHTGSDTATVQGYCNHAGNCTGSL